MTVILWDRTNRDVIRIGGKPVTFKDSAAADAWLARPGVARNQELRPVTIDKLTVQ